MSSCLSRLNKVEGGVQLNYPYYPYNLSFCPFELNCRWAVLTYFWPCCHRKHCPNTTIFKGGGHLELRVRIFSSSITLCFFAAFWKRTRLWWRKYPCRSLGLWLLYHFLWTAEDFSSLASIKTSVYVYLPTSQTYETSVYLEITYGMKTCKFNLDVMKYLDWLCHT